MTTLHNPHTDPFTTTSGAPTVKWANVGDVHTLKVTGNAETRQSTEPDGTKKTFKDGNPMMDAIVPCVNMAGGEECRIWTAMSSKPDSLFGAIKAALGGRPLAPGATLTVKRLDDEPATVRGYSPRRRYAAKVDFGSPVESDQIPF